MCGYGILDKAESNGEERAGSNVNVGDKQTYYLVGQWSYWGMTILVDVVFGCDLYSSLAFRYIGEEIDIDLTPLA